MSIEEVSIVLLVLRHLLFIFQVVQDTTTSATSVRILGLYMVYVCVLHVRMRTNARVRVHAHVCL